MPSVLPLPNRNMASHNPKHGEKHMEKKHYMKLYGSPFRQAATECQISASPSLQLGRTTPALGVPERQRPSRSLTRYLSDYHRGVIAFWDMTNVIGDVQEQETDGLDLRSLQDQEPRHKKGAHGIYIY